MLWEKIAAEEVIKQAPYHGRGEKQDKKRMPSLPRPATRGRDQ